MLLPRIGALGKPLKASNSSLDQKHKPTRKLVTRNHSLLPWVLRTLILTYSLFFIPLNKCPMLCLIDRSSRHLIPRIWKSKITGLMVPCIEVKISNPFKLCSSYPKIFWNIFIPLMTFMQLWLVNPNTFINLDLVKTGSRSKTHVLKIMASYLARCFKNLDSTYCGTRHL